LPMRRLIVRFREAACQRGSSSRLRKTVFRVPAELKRLAIECHRGQSNRSIITCRFAAVSQGFKYRLRFLFPTLISLVVFCGYG
jgi:hypothetical protein